DVGRGQAQERRRDGPVEQALRARREERGRGRGDGGGGDQRAHDYKKYSHYIFLSSHPHAQYPCAMAKRYGQAGPVAKLLELAGERWALLIGRDLPDGPRRYQDFHDSLHGIAPALLSARLKLMEEHGLVARRFYSDHPPRAEYALTDKGRELGVV